MSDYTIVEKYQQTKQGSSIAIRAFFNPNKSKYGIRKLWDGTTRRCLP